MTALLNHLLHFFGFKAVLFRSGNYKQRKDRLHRQLAQELGREWKGRV
ncbi:hypothetical protein LB545_07560 [Mesorhizobium sp. BR1-1-6]|nr:hypothetical protein [Mesorhizobium sp. BR1-1-6]MBZ9894199.1 hypothetical protein [Mesorhizobium sp. BR1-1-6]